MPLRTISVIKLAPVLATVPGLFPAVVGVEAILMLKVVGASLTKHSIPSAKITLSAKQVASLATDLDMSRTGAVDAFLQFANKSHVSQQKLDSGLASKVFDGDFTAAQIQTLNELYNDVGFESAFTQMLKGELPSQFLHDSDFTSQNLLGM